MPPPGAVPRIDPVSPFAPVGRLARRARCAGRLPAGLRAIACAVAFAFVAAAAQPAGAAGATTLASVTHAIGVFGVGTAITLTGTGFIAGATVTFDAVAATGVTVVSATQITATTPAGSPDGPVITVTNPNGQSATLTNAFTYLGNPPTLTAVTPATGSTNGRTSIALTGTAFASGMTVSVGADAATSVVVLSPTQAGALTPAGTAGTQGVTVTNADTQAATLVAAFTCTVAAPPTVTALSPASGTHAGTTAVTITGGGFAQGATVRFGGAAATNVTFVSATSITATAPAGARARPSRSPSRTPTRSRGRSPPRTPT